MTVEALAEARVPEEPTPSIGLSLPPRPWAGRWPGLACALLAVTACGGRTSDTSPSSNSGAAVSSGAVTTGTVSGANSGTSGGSGTGTSGSGASGEGTGVAAGASGTVSTGAVASGTSSGTVVVTPVGDGGPDSGNAAPPGRVSSPGCGKPWTRATGTWVSQPTGCGPGNGNQGTAACQAIPQGGTVPAKATQGSPEYRGWWVYVPTGYDPNKPYRVIYNGAGCGDADWFHAGADGYPYNTVDGGNAILVGLDYDTYSGIPSCYDDRDPQSNDFLFFPWLQNQIENEFCVDTNHEFFSGYSSGAGLAQQLDCALPDKLRGFAAVRGCEPGAPGYPGAQFSPCVSKPTAAFYVHDFNDADTTYACILPACTRVLKQNGCSVTNCDPLDKTITTPYVVPAGVTLRQGGSCVQFNGCPADYPVVFCVTYGTGPGDSQSWGVVPLLWDWMSNRLAD
jgi:hypothetical protein